MKRDLIVCILLVIAGIVLAIVLFGAGAVWRGRTPVRTPRSSLQNRVRINGLLGALKRDSCFSIRSTKGGLTSYTEVI